MVTVLQSRFLSYCNQELHSTTYSFFRNCKCQQSCSSTLALILRHASQINEMSPLIRIKAYEMLILTDLYNNNYVMWPTSQVMFNAIRMY